jgi:nicotinic acid mononucleotide adenylyltransferase
LLDFNGKIFIAATGAGAGIQDRLWEIPGISKVFSGAVFPYSERELTDFLGFEPEKCCSEETAIDMAMTSYIRARMDAKDGQEAIGIGLCASVATLKEHKGDHRIFACCIRSENENGVLVSRILEKGAGQEARWNDGIAADDIGFSFLDANINFHGAQTSIVTKERLLERILFKPHFLSHSRGEATERVRGIIPSSLNPLHEGHVQMAEEISEPNVAFQVCIRPPHKDAPRITELLDKVAAVRSTKSRKNLSVVFSHDKLFTEKFKKWKYCHFGVGADTFERMLDPSWGPSAVEVMNSLDANECHLTVFDRQNLCGFDLAQKHEADIFNCTFRKSVGNLSSTQLREKNAK